MDCSICNFIWAYVAPVMGILMLFSLFSYFFLVLIQVLFCGEQNLKKKYNAEWGIVTGGSSGIGKAVAEKLAMQGINVVIAALADNLLKDTVAELQARYPEVKVIACGVDLTRDGYLEDLEKATGDKKVSIVFNNAGYINTGFFTERPLGSQIANLTCNAVSAMQITYYFVQRMQKANMKGCVVFTSSPAGFMPSPFCCMYGSTKAFLTEFAMSLAPEVKNDGIDVTVVHPSPVASNFYNKAHKLDAIAFFRKTATGPEVIASKMFSTVGRFVVADQGYYSIGLNTLFKFIDTRFMAEATARTAHMLGDYKNFKNKTS
mmetsp:Transcript_44559/g.115882  ORF Transcript_44559/g.115882 Transcript_44559/m.115882 type:complete len:318 (-) Transcript_44559:67-1020(-)